VKLKKIPNILSPCGSSLPQKLLSKKIAISLTRIYLYKSQPPKYPSHPPKKKLPHSGSSLFYLFIVDRKIPLNSYQAKTAHLTALPDYSWPGSQIRISACIAYTA